MHAVILVHDVAVWHGAVRGVTKQLVRVARLRDRFPTIGLLREYLQLPNPEENHEMWDEIRLVRFDNGAPISEDRFPVSPLGRVQRG